MADPFSWISTFIAVYNGVKAVSDMFDPAEQPIYDPAFVEALIRNATREIVDTVKREHVTDKLSSLDSVSSYWDHEISPALKRCIWSSAFLGDNVG